MSILRNNKPSSNCIRIDFRSTIKSIKIPTMAKEMGKSSDCLGIITENSLHILKIHSIFSNDYEMDYTLYNPLPFNKFSDFPFSDVAFNPWDVQEFAVIDIKGNWGVGRIPRIMKNQKVKELHLLNESRGSAFDIEELSNWRRIAWSCGYSRLLLFSRSKVIEVDFQNNWQLDMVEAKSWSNLRDYKPINDTFGFLLTSKEIIVLRTKNAANNVIREVSWKHDLDPNDLTIQISVQTVEMIEGTLYVTYISSKRHNKLFCHAFYSTDDDELLQTLGYSTLINVPRSINGIHTLVFPTSREKYPPDYNNNLNKPKSFPLSQAFLRTYDTSEIFKIIIGNNIASDNYTSGYDSMRIDCTSMVTELSSKFDSLLTNMIRTQISGNESKAPEKADEDIFQDYGYRLSSAMNDVLVIWADMENLKKNSKLCRSIEELTEIPKHFKDLSEFESFLEQFMDYYVEQNISFTNLKSICKMLFHEEIGSFDMLYNKLLQCWDMVSKNSESLTKETIASTIWSVLKFTKVSNYKILETDIHDSLGEPYRAIIDQWDNTSDLEDEDDEQLGTFRSTIPMSSQPQFLLNSQSQIPTIKSSQPRTSKGNNLRPNQGKISKSNLPPLTSTNFSQNLMSHSQVNGLSSTLPNTMTPAFTLMQPATAGMSSSFSIGGSQRAGSQKSKRKKKKVGGFG
ncbi:hypothetical protein NCAS_0C05530 [Naumovozyma castellii]|uniref:RNA polymerase I-specific transcription initiation factor RRN6 n=1 Tax=Naumovozyma castellii TaxID=27288 RepID=G0VDI1_NAUCA|nr:hypothetical protein NCAS_0C05530 [Naumovozyma castellii CBS 4309]CCC69543.1 hypothetical protein NCAS_0C05530 [Naumovozyma castellii CBS 4309]